MAEAKGYLIDLLTLEKLTFQVNPIDIQDNKSLNVGSTDIPGASHPRVSPGSGGRREISFTLRFFMEDADKTYVRKQIEFLRSLIHPHPSDDYVRHGAPPVQFTFGDLYKLPVYITQVNVKYSQLFNPESLEPEVADAQISMVEISPQIISAADVRSSKAGQISPVEIKFS